MASETDGEIGKLIKGLVQGEQVDPASVAPDGTITIPHGEATLAAVDVADVDLLLSFSDGKFVIIPNGALEAISDPSHQVAFTDPPDSVFNSHQPDSHHISTLGDLFKMVGISNHADAGSLRVVSENVDANTDDDADSDNTDEDHGIFANYIPPPPAPPVKVGSSIGFSGKGLGATGYGEELVDTADRVVPSVTDRPSVYKAGHATDTVSQPYITLDANVTADNIINIAESRGDVAVSGKVGGGAQAGDTVTLTVNGNTYAGLVLGDKSFSINVSGSDLVADSARTIDAGITIPSGTATDTHRYGVDITPPVAPGVALATDTGTSGSDHITKSGALTLTGIEAGATVEYSSDGGAHWSGSFTAVEGLNNVLVRQTDVVGNTGSAGSLSFTLDTIAPAAPGVALATDSGASPSDHITDSGALTLSGIETGATVEYSTDGGAHWSGSFTPVEGLNNVQVRQTDVAGNTSGVSSLTFTLDTTVATPTVALTVDSTDGGAGHNADHITNNAALTISAPAETVTREYSVDGGAWSTTYTAPTVDGAHTVTVRDTDIAGNQATGSLTFTLDTTPPSTPTVALTLDSTDGGAGHNTDHITNNAALTIGTASEPVTREYSVDGGAWSTTYTAPTVDGAHTVTVRDTDVAGNSATGSLTFTLDRAIATPTIALTVDSTDGGAGHNTDHITNNAALTISAPAEPVTREYSIDGGAWSTTYTAPTADGSHTVTVRDTDIAGNQATGSLTFTLDTAIAPPTVALANDSTDGGVGHNNDHITNNAALTISAPAEPVTREYSVDGGAWTTTYTAPTVDGSHTVTVRDTDGAGNTATGSLTFTLDTAIAPPTVALANDSTDGGAGHNTDHITNNAALTISAPAEPATREYSVDGGAWSTTYTAPTVDGAHTVTVRDTDIAGNQATGSLTFTLDTTPPSTPTVALTLDSTDGGGGHSTDHITNNAALTISAPAETVTREYSVDGSAWTTTYTAPTVDGSHTVTVRDTDVAGNTSGVSSLTFTLDTHVATPTVALTNDSTDGGTGHNTDLITNNAALTIGAPAETVTREYSVDGNAWTTTYTAPTVDGSHTVQVRDTDVAGNTATGSLTFTLDTTPPSTPTVALANDSTDGGAGHNTDHITNNAALTIRAPSEPGTRE
ncbi:MAG TPA: Ig-like domain-containing protein, partial [Geobacteraceae bacterium]